MPLAPVGGHAGTATAVVSVRAACALVVSSSLEPAAGSSSPTELVLLGKLGG